MNPLNIELLPRYSRVKRMITERIEPRNRKTTITTLTVIISSISVSRCADGACTQVILSAGVPAARRTSRRCTPCFARPSMCGVLMPVTP